MGNGITGNLDTPALHNGMLNVDCRGDSDGKRAAGMGCLSEWPERAMGVGWAPVPTPETVNGCWPFFWPGVRTCDFPMRYAVRLRNRENQRQSAALSSQHIDGAPDGVSGCAV